MRAIPVTRVIVLAFVASIAIGAATSATAYAKCGGVENDETEEWCKNGAALVGAEKLAKNTVKVENFTLAFAAIKVVCGELKVSEGKIEALAKGEVKHLFFASCAKLVGENCELVGNEWETEPVNFTGLKEVGAKEVEGAFSPVKAPEIAKIEFAGEKCAIAGEKLPVTGKIKWRLSAGQNEATEQEIVVNTPSGEVKVGAAAATLKGKAKLKLETGADWSFD